MKNKLQIKYVCQVSSQVLRQKNECRKPVTFSYDLNALLNWYCSFFCFVFLFYLGFMARQDYFTHFESSRS